MTTNADIVIVEAGAAGIAAAPARSPRVVPRWCLRPPGGSAAGPGHAMWRACIWIFGCGWLHSADRKIHRHVAEAAGFAVDAQELRPGVGSIVRPGLLAGQQAAATQAFTDWRRRVETPPASDCAADALEPDGEWNAYLQATIGFLTGAVWSDLGRRLTSASMPPPPFPTGRRGRPACSG